MQRPARGAELSAGLLVTCSRPCAQAAPSARRGSAAEGAEASGPSLLRWEGDTLMGLALLSCIFQRNQET